MATLTNRPITTGTMTNKALGSQGRTWDEANYSWDNAEGTWDNPFGIINKSLNTGTVTNKAITP